MTGRGWCLRAAMLPLFVVGAASCSRHAFDQHLRAGEWAEAATAFAADTALQRDRAAIRKAALLHAVPAYDTWDPERARRLLDDLQYRSRRGRLAPADAALRGTLDRLLKERAAHQAEERRLGALLMRAEREAQEARLELARLEGRLAAHEEERGVLTRLIARLETEIVERDESVRALRSELDRLKAIDLTAPSRSPPD